MAGVDRKGSFMEHSFLIQSARLINSEQRPHGVTVHTVDIVYDKRLDDLSPVEAYWTRVNAALQQIHPGDA
jgi:hypothetical protein